jgi:hypothetical protein
MKITKVLKQSNSKQLKFLKYQITNITVLLFILLPTVFIKSEVALAGGYLKTCPDTYLAQTSIIATCITKSGGRIQTRLYLPYFIANYNGNLVWSAYGNFQQSCERIRLAEPGVLRATCKNIRGGWNTNAVINLNERITNDNAQLKVDGFNVICDIYGCKPRQ